MQVKKLKANSLRNMPCAAKLFGNCFLCRLVNHFGGYSKSETYLLSDMQTVVCTSNQDLDEYFSLDKSKRGLESVAIHKASMTH